MRRIININLSKLVNTYIKFYPEYTADEIIGEIEFSERIVLSSQQKKQIRLLLENRVD